jgi:hypothetical protein
MDFPFNEAGSNGRPVTIEDRINGEPLYRLYKRVWNVLLVGGNENMVSARIGVLDDLFCLDIVAKKEGGFDQVFEEIVFNLFLDEQFHGISMAYMGVVNSEKYGIHSAYRLTSDFETSSIKDADIFFDKEVSFHSSS